MISASYNKVKISKSALCHNYRQMKNQAGDSHPLMAMIKADAYGHGAVEVARCLSETGCEIFGVGEVREGIILREAGIEGEIFIMLGFDKAQTALMFDYNLTPVVFDLESIKSLETEACRRKEKKGIHLKVDTGMSRLGFFPEQIKDIADSIDKLEYVELVGLLSHFPESDVAGSESSLTAIDKFSGICNALKTKYKLICHLANSGGVLNFPLSLFDIARIGISLYGYHPAGEIGADDTLPNLIPAMTCTSKVIQLKEIASGSGISYGHIYKTESTEKIAVLPIGYEDGFSRLLSNKAEVLIGGKRAPVRGRICMNLCMVDVSHIEDVAVGDEVVLLGTQGNETITADEIADKVGTISYEILCMFGHANIKEYID